MANPVLEKLNKALGSRVIQSKPLAGGDIADVSLLTLENHTKLVAKRPRMDQPDTTATEAMMLKHLAKHSELPVPKVLYQAKNILVISYIPNRGKEDAQHCAESAAHHVAALHKCVPRKPAPYYGLEKDTFIGPLPQTNTPARNWCDYFGKNRLLAMGQSCFNTSKINSAFLKRIEALCGKLPDIIPATPDSSLLHGDLWAGNMLFDGDRAVCFIDPAISYGHREMDLAFIDLMGGLDPAFFDVYSEHYPIEQGFYEDRKSIYQLWPLLVHVRLFGGGYVNQVDAILTQYGC